MVVKTHQLDAHDLLLGAKNGVINLKSGGLLIADRNHLITMQIGTSFNPEATCPRWIKFIDEVTGADVELARYLQRLVGYLLTGLTSEQCFFTLWGTGANGKSKFVSLLQRLLGDYAKVVDYRALMVRREGGGPTPELARLPGARLVVASEPNADCRLDEATIKLITGQDRLVCRQLYGQLFEFEPKFKLLLSTNHKPIVRGTDEAIWRRMRLIPFSQIFPPERRDEELESKLLAELPGILNWALEGLQMYFKERLGTPAVVGRATAAYRDEMDLVGQWLEERCVRGVGLRTSVEALYSDYRGWCELNETYSVGKRKFGDELVRRGFDRGTATGNARVYRGLDLKVDR